MSRKLSDIISLGDKIDIKMSREQHGEENGGQMANVYQSSVCDFVSDMELEISMPTQAGRLVLFHTNSRCEFVFYTRRGMYCCSGIVKSRCKKDNLYLLSVEITTEPTKYQRREFFRVDYLTEIKYYEISEETAGLQTMEQIYDVVRAEEYAEQMKHGFLHDISGGGVKFTSFMQHEKDDYLLLMFRLANRCIDENFYLVCRIIESGVKSIQEKTYINRAQFLYKDLRDREKIVRFVFEEERRIRKKDIG